MAKQKHSRFAAAAVLVALFGNGDGSVPAGPFADASRTDGGAGKRRRVGAGPEQNGRSRTPNVVEH